MDDPALIQAKANLAHQERLAKKEGRVAASPSKPLPRPLTEDQRQFRIALKHFALHCPKSLENAAKGVLGQLLGLIKLLGDFDYSFALFQFYHFAFSSGFRSTARLETLASEPLDTMDVVGIQQEVANFFDEYLWLMRAIANTNVILNANLKEVARCKEWLETDKACLREVKNLGHWSEATVLKSGFLGKSASNEKNWTEPYRVNF